jgi:hypothetical protein
MGSDEYAWYSVMLDGMGKTKGAGIHEGVGQTAAAHTRLQQYHALAAHVGRWVGHCACRAGPAGHRVQRKRSPRRLSSLRPLSGEPNALALMRHTTHPHVSILFIDWILSEEAQSLMAQQIPRHQELYKKDFVFVNPASIGANLNELIASYQQVFNIR